MVAYTSAAAAVCGEMWWRCNSDGAFCLLFEALLRTSVTEFWVCMGLTVYNSSKSEGSMMYDDAFFQCIFLHFLANITRMATTPPPRWGTSPRWTRLLKIWRRRAGLAAPLAKKHWRVIGEIARKPKKCQKITQQIDIWACLSMGNYSHKCKSDRIRKKRLHFCI